jgi:AcrR family transcriptional regulator
MVEPKRDAGKRSVGRPRHFDDHDERQLILDAAYTSLREHGLDFTVANILLNAGVSTRSFYRHFESRDALLSAMYLRDAEWAAERLTKRLTNAASPGEAVDWWIDEVFSFIRSPRRAERVRLLGSVMGVHAEGSDDVVERARQILVESLHEAITAGVADGSFSVFNTATAADLVAVVALHAAGLAAPHRTLDQPQTVEFCMRALGVAPNTTPV